MKWCVLCLVYSFSLTNSHPLTHTHTHTHTHTNTQNKLGPEACYNIELESIPSNMLDFLNPAQIVPSEISHCTIRRIKHIDNNGK